MRFNSKDIDLIVYDFDGVMTDNRVIVDENGKESVVCNRSEGLGIEIIKKLDIHQFILSTEINMVVRKRALKLGIDHIKGVYNKYLLLKEYCTVHAYSIEKVMYVGNDINDLEVMEEVRYSVCPADAHDKIKDVSTLILNTRGGYGVVRELAGLID